MRVGVENFVPERLKQALDFRFKTKATVAKEINVTSSSLTSYINGRRRPSPESFEKMVEYLKLPKKFFLKGNCLEGYDDTLKQWRSISNKRLADSKRGEVVLSWLIESHRIFDKVFTLPRFELGSEIDSWNLPTEIGDITDDVAEDAANRVREYWSLGKLPIRNLVRTAEKGGVVVGKFNLNVPQLDAVSTNFEGRPYVLLNSFKQSGCRARFDLAHEIGHLVLHRHVSEEDLSGANGKAIYRKLEEQAHWFAGALLLPADRFTSDFWAPTYQCFIDMKEKWKVSIQAMIRRGLGLDLLTPNQYNWLNIAISKKGARQIEPLDEKIRPETIRLFPKCFERYEEDFGVTALSEVIENIPFSIPIITELFELDPSEIERIQRADRPVNDNLVHFDFRLREREQ